MLDSGRQFIVILIWGRGACPHPDTRCSNRTAPRVFAGPAPHWLPAALLLGDQWWDRAQGLLPP
eukprot:5556147-Alexandrium_andersonii.AAC.1